MFAQGLAVFVAASSLSLYLSVFAIPEIGRKSDIWWSGVGLFYALVLWFCRVQLQGAVLLGQGASVALLAWLGLQVFNWRWRSLSQEQHKQIRSTLGQRLGKALGKVFSLQTFLAIPSALLSSVRKAKSKSTSQPVAQSTTETKATPQSEVAAPLQEGAAVVPEQVPPEQVPPEQVLPKQVDQATQAATLSADAAAEEGEESAAAAERQQPLPESADTAASDIATSLASGIVAEEAAAPVEPESVESAAVAEQEEPTQASVSPAAPQPQPTIGPITRIQDFILGLFGRARKRHGKRYVRPESSPSPADNSDITQTFEDSDEPEVMDASLMDVEDDTVSTLESIEATPEESGTSAPEASPQNQDESPSETVSESSVIEPAGSIVADAPINLSEASEEPELDDNSTATELQAGESNPTISDQLEAVSTDVKPEEPEPALETEETSRDNTTSPDSNQDLNVSPHDTAVEATESASEPDSKSAADEPTKTED